MEKGEKSNGEGKEMNMEKEKKRGNYIEKGELELHNGDS